MRIWDPSVRTGGIPDPWWYNPPPNRRRTAWSDVRALCGRPWTVGIAHVSSGGSSLCRYRSDAIWSRRMGDER